MSPLSHIHALTNRILNIEKNTSGELYTACNELYKALLQITGIDVEEENNRQIHTLGSGDAIGLTWAAMCIQDYMRTKRFMDGIYEATCDKRKTITGRPVYILYAGTGPFATLLLPLIARFSEQQIQFTLLEVNEATFNCLKKLISALQLEKYLHRVEKADATKWKLPANEPVDIFISETMQQGLAKEPQVELCINILSQLPSNTIMIPEQITLTAALVDLQQRMKLKLGGNSSASAVHRLSSIFTLNKETIMLQAANYQQAGEIPPAFPETVVNIPPKITTSHTHLYLLTDIVVYKQQKLQIDQSQLTLPMKLADLSRHQPATIKFQYHTGKSPGIQFSM